MRGIDSHSSPTRGKPSKSHSPPISAFLYDPDPAVTRAGLVHTWRRRRGRPGRLHRATADGGRAHTPTPFATAYRVDEVLPFDPKKVSAALRERHVGRITVVNRGSLADVEAAAKKWKLAGEEHRFVLLTREAGRQVAVVGDRV